MWKAVSRMETSLFLCIAQVLEAVGTNMLHQMAMSHFEPPETPGSSWWECNGLSPSTNPRCGVNNAWQQKAASGNGS